MTEPLDGATTSCLCTWRGWVWSLVLTEGFQAKPALSHSWPVMFTVHGGMLAPKHKPLLSTPRRTFIVDAVKLTILACLANRLRSVRLCSCSILGTEPCLDRSVPWRHPKVPSSVLFCWRTKWWSVCHNACDRQYRPNCTGCHSWNHQPCLLAFILISPDLRGSVRCCCFGRPSKLLKQCIQAWWSSYRRKGRSSDIWFSLATTLTWIGCP